MGRRRLVVFLSAVAMLLLGVGIVGALVGATQSEGGRDWIRRQLARELNRGMKGKLYLGRLSGSFLTDLGVDSLNVTDPDDSVFIASGPVHVTYDPRDLFDGRIVVRSAEVRHPLVVMRRGNDDRWNFRKVFPVPDIEPASPPPARRAFGSLVVFHNVRFIDGSFQLTLPWQPDDSLRGAHRDSAITANLAIAENEIRRVVTRVATTDVHGLQRTWRWTGWTATFGRMRLRHPDSTERKFDVVRMDVNERVPPFAVRNMRGVIRWLGDSIWLDLPHFELPGSTARATGKVFWGNDLPIRYAVKVHSDSVGLNDIAWIYSTLPRTGTGAMDLSISNERDLRVLDYAITNMDVRSARSRLRGSMTYGVGGPVLIAKDVNLEMAPVDFALLETLNGKPFPLPWKGAFTGTLRGRGGPVNHFQVDEAALTFSDHNVPGAVAEGVGRGEVDILRPAFATFHGFQLNLARFDLRSAQFVNPSFPRMNGLVSGTATLDSLWSDVRFSDSDITHRDGDSSAVSHFRGNGRVTLGDESVTFDLALAAVPISASTLALSYPRLPFRGEYSGPLRVRGSVADLSVTADLTGEPGRLQIEGTFGALGPRYRARARGSVSGLDVRRALERAGAPSTDLNARFSLDVEGDSIDNLVGTARVVASRSLVDSVRVYSAQTELRFGAGLVHVDSMRVESAAGLLVANGGLGLSARRTDSLPFRAVLDSLGGFRRYFDSGRAPGESAGDARQTATADSLEGGLRVAGSLTGSLETFSLRAALDGRALRVGGATIRALTGTARLDGLPDSARGVLTARMDSVRGGHLAFDSVTGRAELSDVSHARATVAATLSPGATAVASADIRRHDDTVVVRVDSLAIRTSANAWSLARPATITSAAGGFTIDSLTVAGVRGGTIALRGRVPADSGLDFGLRAEAVPLADVGEFGRSDQTLEGVASLRLELRGSRARPDFSFDGTLRDALVAGLRLERVTADGRYANRRLSTSLEYDRHGVAALRAQAALPLDLSFEPAGPRLLEEPMTGRLRTDSAGLALLETVTKSVTSAQGGLKFDLDLAGTWQHPLLTGALRISGGALQLAPMGDVKLSGVEAEINFLGDSVVIRRVAVRTGAGRNATAELTGTVGIRDVGNPTFDLRLDAQGFNVVKRPGFVDLDLTGGLRLVGAYDAATLTGSLTVDRGSIFVPELYQKRVISLDDPELYRVVDTSAFVERRLMPDLPPRFVDNLSVQSVPIQMGRDVWLRSDEANINLGGLVRITRGRVQRGPRTGQVQLGLEGTLQTVRGTYRFNLGPVQRAFEVESGEMRFFGDPDLDAALNITAVHTVRRFSQQGSQPDVRVRVHIGGSRLSPTAELSSPDSLRVTNADLISYLVTGAPSYEIGGRNGDYTSTAASVLLSSSFSA
ncbi:MAG TPA: translocation/assembly module TamB domain-containing protein, partial [Gemmatimonadaceae bacterium]|nr:translocation/assembly module TamB domain-containing protein [Gemmatimonadaceae bacterium]